MDLTPYQIRKKKHFHQDTTPLEAVKTELFKFWKTEYPAINKGLADNWELGSEIVSQITNVSSPAIVSDTTLPWTSKRLTDLLDALLTLEEIQKESGQNLPKKRIEYLPKHFQKFIKRLYTSIEVRDKLAEAIKSSKAAKKTLRILHKRLGIYTKRKPPFRKETRLT